MAKSSLVDRFTGSEREHLRELIAEAKRLRATAEKLIEQSESLKEAIEVYMQEYRENIKKSGKP